MTVEEKVGQLSLYALAAVDTVANPQGARQSEEEQLAQIRAGRVTGLFNNEGFEGQRRPQWLIIQGRLDGKLLAPSGALSVAPEERAPEQQPQPAGCRRRA